MNDRLSESLREPNPSVEILARDSVEVRNELNNGVGSETKNDPPPPQYG